MLHQFPGSQNAIQIEHLNLSVQNVEKGTVPFSTFYGRGEHLGFLNECSAYRQGNHAVSLRAVGAIAEDVQIMHKDFGQQRPLGITATCD